MDRSRIGEFISGMGEKIALRPGDEEAMSESGLTPRDVQHLRMESQNISMAGLKEWAIRDHLGVTATRHFQIINGLIDTPAAYSHNNGEFAPMLNRLSRIRDAKREARSGRNLLDRN